MHSARQFFLSRHMLPEFAHSLYQSFEQEGIPLLLAGGWAVSHHGYTRFTNDIDWICSREDDSRALELMHSLGFEIVSESMATRCIQTGQNGPMNILDIEFPDFPNHPPPPKLSFEQYQRWICEEIVPALAREGKMTHEHLIADFMRSEGRQTEEWPDFGAHRGVPAVSSGSAANEAG